MGLSYCWRLYISKYGMPASLHLSTSFPLFAVSCNKEFGLLFAFVYFTFPYITESFKIKKVFTVFLKKKKFRSRYIVLVTSRNNHTKWCVEDWLFGVLSHYLCSATPLDTSRTRWMCVATFGCTSSTPSQTPMRHCRQGFWCTFCDQFRNRVTKMLKLINDYFENHWHLENRFSWFRL